MAALALALLLYLSSLLLPLDYALRDAGAWLTTATIDSDIVIVEIDARSLAELSSWPWPRGYHAQAIDRLLSAGAKRVFVDIDFSSVSHPAEDAKLESALRRAGPRKAILPAFHRPASSGSRELLLSRPIERLRRFAELASVNVWPGPDGLVRELPMREPGGQAGLRAAAAVLNDWRHPPLAPLLIDFSISPESFVRLSYADVLAGRFPPVAVDGKQVIVGATAVELGDMVPVPLYRTLPGAVLQALASASIKRGPLAAAGVGPVLTVCLLLGIALTPVFRKLPWRWGSATTLLISVLTMAVCVYLVQVHRLVFDGAAVILAVSLTYLFHLLARLDQQSMRLWWQRLELRKKEELITNIVGNSLDAILTINMDGSIESMNPAAEQMFRRTSGSLIGRSIGNFIPHMVSEKNGAASWNEMLLHGQVHELTANSDNGDTFPVDLAMSRIEVEGTQLITAIVRDISVRKEQETQLRYKATHDSLTDLANRDFLVSHISECTTNAPNANAALLMLDLVQLKEINDTLGHDVGDLIIKQIARRFASTIPEHATLARIGGDEFAVFLQADKYTVLELARCLQSSLQQPFYAKGIALRAGVSIGLAYYPEHGHSSQLLLQHADVAMYMAKRSGAPYQIYDPALDHHTVRRLQLAGKLRSAIDENRLVMYYQPTVRVDGTDVLSVEALMRWEDPEFGLIMPDEFMELAEKSDLIGELTDWTLDRCLAQYVSWNSETREPAIAINVSARIMQDSAFSERLIRFLDKYDVDPRAITLEITENAFMSDPRRALETAAKINQLGVRLAIDDFGIGYSSFAYLKNLPIHKLKIDKSFIIGMDHDTTNDFIVEAIITLAHGLGLEVVAEGVESESVYQHLKRMRCDQAQGFWISRPLRPEYIIAWWRKWQKRQRTLAVRAVDNIRAGSAR